MLILYNAQYSMIDYIMSQHPHLTQYLGFLNTARRCMNWERLFSYGLPVCADNGAFSGFDRPKFLRFVDRLPDDHALQWLAVPDCVGDAVLTSYMFEWWEYELRHLPLALVAQDGIEDMLIPWRLFTCLFVGGTTDWKLSNSALDVAREAKRRGKWLHLGRVNSEKRLEYAYVNGYDSVDGSSFWRLSKHYLMNGLNVLDRLHRQGSFL